MSSQNNMYEALKSQTLTSSLETYLSSSEVCQKLKISQKTLQRWEKDGILIPSVRIHGRRLYEEWTIIALLNQKTVLYGTGKTSEKQFRILSSYLEKKHIIGEVRIDWKSPYDLSRPFFLQTMAEIFERKVSCIIVTHEDRFLPIDFMYQDFFKSVRCSFLSLNNGRLEDERDFDKNFLTKNFIQPSSF